MRKKSREEILDELIATGFIEKYARQLSKACDEDYIEDGIQDIWLIILNLSEEKLQDLYYSQKTNNINAVRRYCSGIIHRQIVSTSSAYYKQYHKPHLYDDENTSYSIADKEELGLFAVDFLYMYGDEEGWENNITL